MLLYFGKINNFSVVLIPCYYFVKWFNISLFWADISFTILLTQPIRTSMDMLTCKRLIKCDLGMSIGGVLCRFGVLWPGLGDLWRVACWCCDCATFNIVWPRLSEVTPDSNVSDVSLLCNVKTCWNMSNSMKNIHRNNKGCWIPHFH